MPQTRISKPIGPATQTTRANEWPEHTDIQSTYTPQTCTRAVPGQPGPNPSKLTFKLRNMGHLIWEGRLTGYLLRIIQGLELLILENGNRNAAKGAGQGRAWNFSRKTGRDEKRNGRDVHRSDITLVWKLTLFHHHHHQFIIIINFSTTPFGVWRFFDSDR